MSTEPPPHPEVLDPPLAYRDPVFLESEVSNMNNFIKEAAPVLDGGIKWKV